ncbi:hypothetical protein SAMN06296058_1492 [Pseudoxanthomonas indica]|uniref:Carbon-nitrogen hydrolase n=1 Tax=Pseudoxanthomonas indica TaxID=428993 RepID=A0A1T5K9W2_9GAMM|nr:hypothetical protein SAMN06296058_1492 [Pseudoxanthomonas indica]
MTLDVVTYERRILVGSELWLCIGQLSRSKNELTPAHRNRAAADAVCALLECNADGLAPIDLDCDNPLLTRLLVLPELSLGFDDWSLIDQAIRNYNKAILVVAGFGFTKVKSLRTRLHFPEGTSDGRNVNFGCVWVKLPASGDTEELHDAHYYCKNFPEQTEEQPAFDPVRATSHKALIFQDCTFAPLICADLLADSEAQKPNAVDQLKTLKQENGKPLIVAASVLQETPWHGIWSSRLDRVTDCGFVLALANYSHKVRPATYDDDPNRNLSGAYAAAGTINGTLPDSIDCSARDGQTARGTVLRDSCEVFTAGLLRVENFSSTKGRHLWLVRWGQTYSNAAFTRISTRLTYEIPRICHRTKHLQPSASAISRVTSHLEEADDARKASFFLSISEGPNSTSTDPNPSLNSSTNKSMENALRVADALSRSSYFPWPTDLQPTLMVNIPTTEQDPSLRCSAYVWSSTKEHWSGMASSLQSYIDDPIPRPALVVFAEDMNGIPLNQDDVTLQFDTTGPREDAQVDSTAPRAHANTVIALPFSTGLRISSVVDTGTYPDTIAQLRISILTAAGLIP